jgi:hypothetical protein
MIYQMRWEMTLPGVASQYPQDNVSRNSRALQIPGLNVSMDSIHSPHARSLCFFNDSQVRFKL